jgi:hypothetical protein
MSKAPEVKEETSEKIDYMHPNGTPAISDEQKKINREEQEKPVTPQSLAEADGHHVCTDECLGHDEKK